MVVLNVEAQLKPTTVGNVSPITFTGRTVQSYFLGTDPTVTVSPLKNMASGERTIVMQPGSKNLKIGLAKDAFPKLVPHLIAHRRSSSSMDSDDDSEDWCLDAEALKDALTARNKQAKKKQPPNIYTSLQAYNKAIEPQHITSHNDSYTFDWTETAGRPYICGKEALRIDPSEGYHLIWPIKRGTIDRSIYGSYREAIKDLELIWTWAIRNVLKISGPLSDFAVMMVVPATASRWEIKAYTECLFSNMGVGVVTFMHEPVACTFGAGILNGCVVDLGAQTVSVACVEEGSILPESLVKLDYGGDDVTRLLYQILRHHCFPYEISGLKDPLDFELLNDLRERFCTLDEEELQSLVYEFFVRRPGKTTLHYNFKVIEERFLAVQAMLEPGASWLAPFEKQSRAKKMEAIMKFQTGSYDVETDQDKPSSNAQTTMANTQQDGDVEMVDVLQETAATQQSSPAEPTQEIVKFDCKWDSCTADPFETPSEIVLHIKETHLGSVGKCKWSDCAFSLPSSEMSKIGHLMDHLNPTMNCGPSSAETVPFIHTEPQPRPIQPLSLDEAIWTSCGSNSYRSLSSILLVGGLSQTPGLHQSLLTLLSARLASLPIEPEGHAAAPPPTIEFVGGVGKDLDPAFYGWKGGAVGSKLEATMETWIQAEEWRMWGPKLFKERLPFTF